MNILLTIELARFETKAAALFFAAMVKKADYNSIIFENDRPMDYNDEVRLVGTIEISHKVTPFAVSLTRDGNGYYRIDDINDLI